jgi:hypothetical protein
MACMARSRTRYVHPCGPTRRLPVHRVWMPPHHTRFCVDPALRLPSALYISRRTHELFGRGADAQG